VDLTFKPVFRLFKIQLVICKLNIWTLFEIGCKSTVFTVWSVYQFMKNIFIIDCIIQQARKRWKINRCLCWKTLWSLMCFKNTYVRCKLKNEWCAFVPIFIFGHGQHALCPPTFFRFPITPFPIRDLFAFPRSFVHPLR